MGLVFSAAVPSYEAEKQQKREGAAERACGVRSPIEYGGVAPGHEHLVQFVYNAVCRCAQHGETDAAQRPFYPGISSEPQRKAERKACETHGMYDFVAVGHVRHWDSVLR